MITEIHKYDHFKFKVGQFCKSAWLAEDALNGTTLDSSRQLAHTYQIVSRTYKETQYGICLSYNCRSVGFLGERQLVELAENELVSLDD